MELSMFNIQDIATACTSIVSSQPGHGPSRPAPFPRSLVFIAVRKASVGGSGTDKVGGTVPTAPATFYTIHASLNVAVVRVTDHTPTSSTFYLRATGRSLTWEATLWVHFRASVTCADLSIALCKAEQAVVFSGCTNDAARGQGEDGEEYVLHVGSEVSEVCRL